MTISGEFKRLVEPLQRLRLRSEIVSVEGWKGDAE
jgi:hypothetical protein